MDRRTYRLALAGLAAVLMALGGFGLWSAAATNDASARASAASRVSDAYARVRLAVGEEESLRRQYRLETAAATRTRYDAAGREVVGALRELRSIGPADDRRVAGELMTLHDRFRATTGEMLAATDAGDRRRTSDIDRASSLFTRIEARVSAEAAAHHAAAQQSLQELRATASSTLTATLLVLAAGLVLLGSFGALLARVQRALARHAAEREHDALHDPLTGLPNRALFTDRLEQAIGAAERSLAPFSLLMVDLDRFKEINDSLGHAAGDLLLQAAASRLQASLRRGDTIARLGGDEFALVLPATSSDEARRIAERSLEELREPLELPDVIVAIDASIGSVTFPGDGESAATLLQRADVAMYLAKQRGGGEMRYDADRDTSDPTRLALSAELRRAIDQDELEVHYQPKFETRTLALCGVEALVRWRHPERGLLYPDAFIPVAEHNGMIRDLTLSVLRTATRQLAAWRADGHDLSVAVNLSVANLLDHRFVEEVAEILAEEDAPADRLELEITETMLMSDPERATALLERLAAMGIRLSIDDFGTGYSSLAYMRTLPISEVKIDRSFVRNMAVDEGDAAIVRATIELSHSLALQVVGEGVEDARSLELLRDLGCDSAQGYHLARPAPPDALAELLGMHATPISQRG